MPDTSVTVAPLPPAIELPPPPQPPVGSDPLDALDGKLQSVMKSIRKKDAIGALDFATKWRNAQPGDVLAWIGLGEALEASGDRAGAAQERTRSHADSARARAAAGRVVDEQGACGDAC